MKKKILKGSVAQNRDTKFEQKWLTIGIKDGQGALKTEIKKVFSQET